MQVKLNFFGAFREVGNHIMLQLDQGAKIDKLRETLVTQLTLDKAPVKIIELVKISQFANEKTLLAEDELINEGEEITILPPVSGG